MYLHTHAPPPKVMEVLTAKMRLGEEPLRLRIAAMHQAAADEERALQERRDERERRSALFFRAELGVQAGLLLELAGAQQRVDADLAALGKRQAVHRAGCESDEFVSRVAAGQASVVEREAMRVPLGSRRWGCVGGCVMFCFASSCLVPLSGAHCPR